MRIIQVIRVMQIIVLTNEALKEELVVNGVEHSLDCIYVDSLDDLLRHANADGFIDLLFEPTIERVNALKTLLPKPVIINSVTHTLSILSADFIRINSWPTFLASALLEGAASESQKIKGEEILMQFHKKVTWLPDTSGFISARVISKIINEAWLALEENVSTPAEIDLAMRLGTNYPFGPLEWAEKIGVEKLQLLLDRMDHEKSTL
jgi:3-hydroxybutyryl-CoA dehydrogenase